VTLPPIIRDWPVDAVHDWHERVGMMLDVRRSVSREVEREAEVQAEGMVRAAWRRRGA
jgi:muconolactone delta-isomerase